jgi:hypothetical protein
MLQRLATAAQAIAVLSQSVQQGSNMLALAHSQNRELTPAEIDSVFLKDAGSLAQLDQHLKDLGA